MQCHYYFRSILPSPLRSFDGGKIAAELGSIKVNRPEQPGGGNFAKYFNSQIFDARWQSCRNKFWKWPPISQFWTWCTITVGSQIIKDNPFHFSEQFSPFRCNISSQFGQSNFRLTLVGSSTMNFIWQIDELDTRQKKISNTHIHLHKQILPEWLQEEEEYLKRSQIYPNLPVSQRRYICHIGNIFHLCWTLESI